MSILVLGATGMLGHKVFQTLFDEYEKVCCTVRKNNHPFLDNYRQAGVVWELDVMDLNRVRKFLRDIRPSVVINCIGILKGFSKHAEDYYKCITVNSALPHMIASLISNWGGRLITYSSDCVFAGTEGNYRECDQPDSPSLYGKTKHLGEVVDKDNAITLRTSFIGRELRNYKMLLEWFLTQDGAGTVDGYARALWSGISNIELAKLTSVLIGNEELSGLYHVTSTEPVSKYGLLNALRQEYDIDVELEFCEKFVPDKICDRSMIGDKLVADLGYVQRNWRDMAIELAADETSYESWR